MMVSECSCGRVFKTIDDYLERTSRFRICEEQNLWFECSCHSCLILPKGEYEWFSPADRMSPEAASLFSQIGAIKQLPLIPSAINRLEQVVASEKTSSKDIELCIRDVPALGVAVLHKASCLKLGGGNIETMQHAVSYLGRSLLRELVAASSAQTFKFKSKLYNEKTFWAESNLTAQIAERLCRLCAPQLNPSHVFIAGSLANIGKLVSAIVMPDQIDEMVRRDSDPKTQKPWPQMEKEGKAHDHTVLGEIAAALWGFPEHVLDTIMHHHTPVEIAKERIGATEIHIGANPPVKGPAGPTVQQVVTLANQLSHFVMKRPERIDGDLFEGYLGVVKLSSAQLDSFLKEFDKPVA